MPPRGNFKEQRPGISRDGNAKCGALGAAAAVAGSRTDTGQSPDLQDRPTGSPSAVAGTWRSGLDAVGDLDIRRRSRVIAPISESGAV